MIISFSVQCEKHKYSIWKYFICWFQYLRTRGRKIRWIQNLNFFWLYFTFLHEQVWGSRFNPCFKIPSCFAKYYRICFFIYSFCSNNTVFNILQSRLHPHDAKKFSIKRLTYLHCFNLLSGWLKEMFRSNEFTNVLTFNPSILLSYHIMGLLLKI